MILQLSTATPKSQIPSSIAFRLKFHIHPHPPFSSPFNRAVKVTAVGRSCINPIRFNQTSAAWGSACIPTSFGGSSHQKQPLRLTAGNVWSSSITSKSDNEYPKNIAQVASGGFGLNQVNWFWENTVVKTLQPLHGGNRAQTPFWFPKKPWPDDCGNQSCWWMTLHSLALQSCISQTFEASIPLRLLHFLVTVMFLCLQMIWRYKTTSPECSSSGGAMWLRTMSSGKGSLAPRTPACVGTCWRDLISKIRQLFTTTRRALRCFNLAF